MAWLNCAFLEAKGFMAILELEPLRRPSQFGGGGGEPQSGKNGEIVLNGERRRHQPSTYLANGVAERAWHQVKVIGQKFVGVQNFNPIGRDYVLRKVLQVAGDDHITASNYRCGENMTVVVVGKIKCGDKRLVSNDQAIPCSLIHPIAGAFEGCSITVRFVAEQGIDPLPMDVSRPLRAE